MSWTCMESFSFILLTASEEKIFEYFFENLSASEEMSFENADDDDGQMTQTDDGCLPIL